jgi:hypothetical protein
LPTFATTHVLLLVVAPVATHDDAEAGPVTGTAVVHVNHAYETVGAGVPRHVPGVTVADVPTRVFPEMTGAVATDGDSVTTAVDAHRLDVPTLLVAVTLTAPNLPTFATTHVLLLVVAPVATHDDAEAGPVTGTAVVHVNHAYETVGAGVPRHVPGVTVADVPTRVFPEMTGAVVTEGDSVTTAVDADHDV